MVTLRSDTSVSQVTFDHLCDVFLRSQAHDGFCQLSFLEKEQSWDTANGVSSGHIRVLVYVQFGHCRPAIEFRREGVNRRCEPPAGAAPLGPEVNQHD